MSRFSADRIHTVAVLGAGTMGHGIAQVAAQLGCTVALYDVDDAAATRGRDKIAATLSKGVELGKVTPAARDQTLALIKSGADLAAACAGADLIVEAAPEKLSIKGPLFAAADRAAPAAILATN